MTEAYRLAKLYHKESQTGPIHVVKDSNGLFIRCRRGPDYAYWYSSFRVAHCGKNLHNITRAWVFPIDIDLKHDRSRVCKECLPHVEKGLDRRLRNSFLQPAID